MPVIDQVMFEAGFLRPDYRISTSFKFGSMWRHWRNERVIRRCGDKISVVAFLAPRHHIRQVVIGGPVIEFKQRPTLRRIPYGSQGRPGDNNIFAVIAIKIATS